MFIREFESKDQMPAKALIYIGLSQYFDVIDETLNPDVDDLASSFADGCFLIGELGRQLIATGGYKKVDENTVKIERVFIHPNYRRLGLASQVVNALFNQAQKSGYKRIVLETTSTWDTAIQFWLKHGFQITHRDDSGEWSETWFEREI
jgi:putative acetyltransferase